MQCQSLRNVIPWIVLASVQAGICAAQAPGNPSSAETTLAALSDDARLNDVAFVSSTIGWAVGDRGVIWRTADGGAHWQSVSTSVDAPLRSICFLTDKVGWIAGGAANPFSTLSTGVVLATVDGGGTWQRIDGGKLPSLHHVRFFDLQHGIATGDPPSNGGSGVFNTRDGGRTWEPIRGGNERGWRCGAFLGTDSGFVAGANGRISLVSAGELLSSRVERLGPQPLHDVVLQANGTGWLVGAGAVALRTRNAGLVWEAPHAPLPPGTKDIFDFHAAVVVGNHLWIAGSPGSVIWHSPDSGNTWERQYTGQTLPIRALTFANDKLGWGVGELGVIIHTQDGGKTWHTLRGAQRRAAFVGIPARPDDFSLHLVAKQSGELGYRSAVIAPVRQTAARADRRVEDLDARTHEAIVAAGGCAGELGWQFPVEIPDLERDVDLLLKDWKQRAEGQSLPDVFLGKLAMKLRVWRPDVVIVNEPTGDDAPSQLVYDAVLHAVARAADPTFFVQHQELAGLEPWKVRRVYARVAADKNGDAHVDPHEFLLRLGKTVQAAAAAAYGRLTREIRPQALREEYRVVFDSESSPDQPAATAGDFFAGIALQPGSDPRREIASLDGSDASRQRELANRTQTIQAYAERMLDDPTHRAQLAGHLSQVGAGLTNDQAALELVRIANEYRSRNELDLAEATLVELVMRYPDEPATAEARRWLFHLWSGAEPAWNRVRRTQVTAAKVDAFTANPHSRIQEALARAQQNAPPLAESDFDLSSALEAPGQLQLSGGREDSRASSLRHWQDEAIRMAALMRAKSPQLYRTPEIQFPLAALLRSRGVYQTADRVYRDYVTETPAPGWPATAASEIWMLNPIGSAPKPAVECRFATERPQLDGVLADACWQGAHVQELHDKPGSTSSERTLVMWAYDATHLYFAASIPRHPSLPITQLERSGRTHDADLSGHDRISLFLDTDRDCATFYTLSFDCRGQVAERCWQNPTWNPDQLYVAAESDDRRWRIEAAIAFEELTPVPPVKGTVWAGNVLRLVPGIGVQSWTAPAEPHPVPESFGLMRFE